MRNSQLSWHIHHSKFRVVAVVLSKNALTSTTKFSSPLPPIAHPELHFGSRLLDLLVNMFSNWTQSGRLRNSSRDAEMLLSLLIESSISLSLGMHYCHKISLNSFPILMPDTMMFLFFSYIAGVGAQNMIRLFSEPCAGHLRSEAGVPWHLRSHYF